MPIVWRTILVRPETSLAKLHGYVQASMGWRDCHLFAFTVGGKNFGIPDPKGEFRMKLYDARRYTLARLFSKLPARIQYVYDFGDWWEHVVEIEREEPAQYRKRYPICVAGAEACPPEDCGGPPGYRALLGGLKDPSQPRPANFSCEEATWRMRSF